MSEHPAKPHIVVVGLMGVGKTTAGTMLAKTRNVPYIDSDHDIETLFGVTGRTLVDTIGVLGLHELEAGLLLGALARSEPSVITAAASVIENDLVLDALDRRANVVWLRADLAEILQRQALDGHRRPMGEPELLALSRRREPLFHRASNVVVDAMDPAELVVANIEHQLHELDLSRPTKERT